jgi:hypothetical protein
MSPLTYAAAGIGIALLAVIGVLSWQNSHLQDRAIAAEAVAATAIAANKSWSDEADKINGTINGLKKAQEESAATIAAEMDKVNKNAGWLVNSAMKIASQPLPVAKAQDCPTLEGEIRDYLKERRLKP